MTLIIVAIRVVCKTYQPLLERNLPIEEIGHFFDSRYAGLNVCDLDPVISTRGVHVTSFIKH